MAPAAAAVVSAGEGVKRRTCVGVSPVFASSCLGADRLTHGVPRSVSHSVTARSLFAQVDLSLPLPRFCLVRQVLSEYLVG